MRPLDATARIIDPAAWRAYDEVMGPFLRGGGPVGPLEAFAHRLTHGDLGLRTAEEADAWFRNGKPGSHGVLSLRHGDFQMSLSKAAAILEQLTPRS